MSTLGAASADGRLAKLGPGKRALLEQRLLARRAAAVQRDMIGRRDVESPVPLSYAQELLWLLSQIFDGGAAYNVPGAFQLRGALDVEVLTRALEALVERHAILRTTYPEIDGKPMQSIGTTQTLELNVVDLRVLPQEDRHVEAQRLLKAESRRGFDLVNGPVMRSTVMRLADDEHILMLTLHHIATDGHSRGVMYQDLTALYDALANNRSVSLPPLAIEYADYAVWQRRWLDAGVAETQLKYWRRKLAALPARLDLPTDLPRPPVRSYTGKHRSMMLDIATREGLRAIARVNGATLFVGLVSVFAMLLGRYAGQDDVVIGTPFAGRNRTELEPMLGYFINPLALRIDLSGDPTFSELLVRVRETTLEAFANADVPYEKVVGAINPERDLSQTPVFQAMMVLHNPAWQTDRPRFEPGGIRCSEISHEMGWAKFDLLLAASERTTGMNTTWEYSTDLFKESTVGRMMEHFRALAESAGHNPDRPLSRLAMLSESERAKVLVSWNAPSAPLPPGGSIKELFEEQAVRTPDAAGVVFGDGNLTYDELNRRANQIAWLLRGHGVGPGTLVGVLMGKSLDLVPVVLGVIKAGGAYLPLDPGYPPERLEFMIADAAPEVLVTHQDHLNTLAHSGLVVTIDSPGALEGFSQKNPATASGGDDLAYIIYTSGSTGRPRGVMITNRSVVSGYFAWERAYRLRESTAHAQLASFSFDVFTEDMIRSLLSGAKLVLCPLDVVVDPAALYALMVREGIDTAEFVPATATMLFDHVSREGLALDFMRLIIAGCSPHAVKPPAFPVIRTLRKNVRIVLHGPSIWETGLEPATDRPDLTAAPRGCARARDTSAGLGIARSGAVGRRFGAATD